MWRAPLLPVTTTTCAVCCWLTAQARSIGSAFGSPFPPAVYIGHPGWKDAGGRAGYSLASGVVIGLFCFLGLFGVLDALLPVPAIVPILLYIGLLIGAQAFQAVPRLHAVAVVAAILPNLAQWASGLIDNALNAAGTSADKVGPRSTQWCRRRL